MVEKNINIAYKVFWQYYPNIKGLIEFEDGISICLEGLIKAVQHYDETKGFTFSTFAYTVIRNHLLGHVRSLNNKKLNTVSLEDNVNSSDESCDVGYFIADSFNLEDKLEQQLTNEMLYEFIDELPPLNKKIMHLYLRGLTQQQIADNLDLSQAHINRIFNKSINILRVKFSRKEMM